MQGKYTEAEPLFQRTLQIGEQQFGSEHTLVATALNGLALLCYHQGKYIEAEPLYQQALGIWKKLFGSEHPLVSYVLNNLAILYFNQGKSSENSSNERGWGGEKGNKKEKMHASA
jgi:tetratricopeptide (TPR) repeat protein